MEWVNKRKVIVKRNSIKNNYMFIKISKQLSNNKESEFPKLTTSKILKEYLDEKKLGFFKFGVDKKGNKTRLFILFSNEEDSFYSLRNEEGNHKITVSIKTIVEDLKEDGIELPLERLKLEEVVEADKVKFGLDKEAHLFEVHFPTTSN